MKENAPIEIESSSDDENEIKEERKILSDSSSVDNMGLRIYTEKQLDELSHLSEREISSADFDVSNTGEEELVPPDAIPQNMFEALSDGNQSTSSDEEKGKQKKGFEVSMTSSYSHSDWPPQIIDKKDEGFIISDSSSEKEISNPITMAKLLGIHQINNF